MDADDTPDQVGIFEFQFQSHCRFVSVAHVGQQLVERVDGAEAGRRMMFLQLHFLQKSIKYLLLTWATSWLGVLTERKRCGRRGSTSGNGMSRVGSPA